MRAGVCWGCLRQLLFLAPVGANGLGVLLHFDEMPLRAGDSDADFNKLNVAVVGWVDVHAQPREEVGELLEALIVGGRGGCQLQRVLYARRLLGPSESGGEHSPFQRVGVLELVDQRGVVAGANSADHLLAAPVLFEGDHQFAELVIEGKQLAAVLSDVELMAGLVRQLCQEQARGLDKSTISGYGLIM